MGRFNESFAREEITETIINSIFQLSKIFTNLDELKEIISIGTNINEVNKDGNNILSQMFSNGSTNIIEYPNNNCYMDINYINPNICDSYLHLILRYYHNYNLTKESSF
jgi:hypothetical protein